MDPVLGSVLVSFIAAAAAIVTAVITARNSADRLRSEDLIRRLKKCLMEKHGETQEYVDQL